MSDGVVVDSTADPQEDTSGRMMHSKAQVGRFATEKRQKIAFHMAVETTRLSGRKKRAHTEHAGSAVPGLNCLNPLRSFHT